MGVVTGIVWETYHLKGSHVLGGPWKFHWSWKGFIHNINVCTKYPHLLDLDSFNRLRRRSHGSYNAKRHVVTSNTAFWWRTIRSGVLNVSRNRLPHKSKRVIYDVSTAFGTPTKICETILVLLERSPNFHVIFFEVGAPKEKDLGIRIFFCQNGKCHQDLPLKQDHLMVGKTVKHQVGPMF